MRKLSYLTFLVMSIVLISCGGKNSESKENKETKTEEAKSTDCLISELSDLYYKKDIIKKDSKEAYTGFAVTKDQSDSIVRKVEIKKGWLVRDIVKEKINGKYITISDLNYEDTKITNGFELKIVNYTKGFYHTHEYKEYKKGKDYNTWICGVNPDINQIQFKWGCKDGVSVPYGTQPGSVCMKDYYNDHDAKYYTSEESNEEYNRILECLKKELPHFDYWIEK